MIQLPTNTRKYEITAIQDNHREILRRLTLGQKAVDIAADLNCTPAVISYVRNSQLGRKELNVLQTGRNKTVTDLREQIEEAAPEAFQTLQELRRGKDTSSSLKSRIAMDTLDRGGFGAVKKIANLSGNLTPEDLEDIKARAKENRRNRIEEAEVIEAS